LELRYRPRSLPELEAIVYGCARHAVEEQVGRIALFTSCLAQRAELDPFRVEVGGTEE
jgi:hypothetical protein